MTRLLPLMILILPFAPMSAQDAPESPKLGVMIVEDESGAPGVIIDEVLPGSAAEKAGLKIGDRVVRFGDLKIEHDSDLRGALAKTVFGRTVTVGVQRGGKSIDVSVSFNKPAAFGRPAWTDAPAKSGTDETREALERALEALKAAGDAPGIQTARDEIARALKTVEKLGRPAATLRGGFLAGPAGGLTILGGTSTEPADGVFSRVRELSIAGKSPEEIEEEIKREFPGANVRIAGGVRVGGDGRWDGDPERDAREKLEERKGEIERKLAEGRRKIARLGAEDRGNSTETSAGSESSAKTETKASEAKAANASSIRNLSISNDGKGNVDVKVDCRCECCQECAEPCVTCHQEAQRIKTEKVTELKGGGGKK